MPKKSVQTIQLDGRICHIYDHIASAEHSAAITLFWCAQAQSKNQTEELARMLVKHACGVSWRLAAVEAEDWFADYSPWAAGDSVQGDFKGGGLRTLQWFAEKGVPTLRQNPQSLCLIGGYSLGGLFALWAFYASDLFAGAASCSGSLWYPGWDAYADSARAPRLAAVYLSLGKMEPLTRHPQMSQVGCATQAQFARLQADPLVFDCTLEWNEGGHFTQPLVRMAQGFSWLMQRFR